MLFLEARCSSLIALAHRHDGTVVFLLSMRSPGSSQLQRHVNKNTLRCKVLSSADKRVGRSVPHATEYRMGGATGKGDGGAGVEGKISAHGQFGDAMNKRP